MGVWFGGPTYYLISTVTGQKITTLVNGANEGYEIHMGATKIVTVANNTQTFTVTDPVIGSNAVLRADGTVNERTELAALGTSVPLFPPTSFPPLEPTENGYIGDSEFGCRDEYGNSEPCIFGIVRAQRAAAPKGKRPPKVPIGILLPKSQPKLPWSSPEKGPSIALAAAPDDPSGNGDEGKPCMIGGEKGTIIDGGCVLLGGNFEVKVDAGDPFEGLTAKSAFQDEPLPLLPRPRIPFVIPPDYAKQYAYRNYGARFNDCLKEKFGKAYGTIGVQTLANSAELNADYTGEELGIINRMRRATRGTKITPEYLKGAGYLAGISSSDGLFGTVYVAKQSYNGTRGNSTFTDVLDFIAATYFHELANRLAIKAKGDENAFGKKGKDPDSGWQVVEECMRKK